MFIIENLAFEFENIHIITVEHGHANDIMMLHIKDLRFNNRLFTFCVIIYLFIH